MFTIENKYCLKGNIFGQKQSLLVTVGRTTSIFGCQVKHYDIENAELFNNLLVNLLPASTLIVVSPPSPPMLIAPFLNGAGKEKTNSVPFLSLTGIPLGAKAACL